MSLPVRFFLFVGVVLAPVAAAAAPQMLGLIATDKPVKLTCRGDVCMAELSTFCLQKERASPETGTVYRVAEGSSSALIVAGADGAIRELPVRNPRFETLRGMSAVRITIDRRALPEGSGVSLQVLANASLVPVPAAHHSRPLTPAEISETTGAMRAVGTRTVDRSPEALVLRGLSEALNRPMRQREFKESDASGPAAPLIRECARQVVHSQALRSRTIGIYGYWTGRGIGHEPSLRACLETAHDGLVGRLNEDYWHAKDSLMY